MYTLVLKSKYIIAGIIILILFFSVYILNKPKNETISKNNQTLSLQVSSDLHFVSDVAGRDIVRDDLKVGNVIDLPDPNYTSTSTLERLHSLSIVSVLQVVVSPQIKHTLFEGCEVSSYGGTGVSCDVFAMNTQGDFVKLFSLGTETIITKRRDSEGNVIHELDYGEVLKEIARVVNIRKEEDILSSTAALEGHNFVVRPVSYPYMYRQWSCGDSSSSVTCDVYDYDIDTFRKKEIAESQKDYYPDYASRINVFKKVASWVEHYDSRDLYDYSDPKDLEYLFAYGDKKEGQDVIEYINRREVTLSLNTFQKGDLAKDKKVTISVGSTTLFSETVSSSTEAKLNFDIKGIIEVIDIVLGTRSFTFNFKDNSFKEILK